MLYHYIDGLWVTTQLASEAVILRVHGARQEPVGWKPDSGALQMTFKCWYRNMVAAAKLDRINRDSL